MKLKEKCIIFRRGVYYICIIKEWGKRKRKPLYKGFLLACEVPGAPFCRVLFYILEMLLNYVSSCKSIILGFVVKCGYAQ